MILDPHTYSRIDVTCDNGNISGICKIRLTTPSPHFETRVVDFTGATVTPTTKDDALVKLTSALAWHAANYGPISGQQPAGTYSHFELQCSNDEVTLLVTSKDGSDNDVTSPQTTLTLDESGPFGDAAMQLLEAAHAFVVAGLP